MTDLIIEEEAKQVKQICAICGIELTILVAQDKSYSGGHFFGLILEHEYWECDDCYKERPKEK